MRDMTTAEFAKANLAALEEPVKIRRYTKAVGTYYPEGYIAALPDAEIVPVIPDQTPSLSAAREKIEDLEDEVRRLKRDLAARPMAAPTHPMKDVFSDLAKQDREFFERKLGTKKK